MTDALASIDALGDFMGKDFDPTDAHALRALDSASALIRGECGQTFELVEDDTANLNGTGRRELLLPAWPVTDVTQITIDDDLLTSDDDFRFSSAGVLTLVGACWPKGWDNIVVVYSHGYEAVPDDVEALCLEVAARALLNPLSAITEQAGSYQGQYAPDVAPLTPFDKALLARYRSISPG